MRNDYALIIGINDYTPVDQSGLNTLKGAINDAHYFEEWVRRKDGGNVPKKNCFKIISEPNPLRPIQDEVDIAITYMLAAINDSSSTSRRLYFYFAGHGLGTLHNISDTALCLANWSEIRRNTALSSEAYKENIRQFGLFEEIIFIADCCRNTKINVNPLHPSFAAPMPSDASARTRMFVGYATQYQDQSYEIEAGASEKRGVFTKVLIDGLNGAAVNDLGIVTADTLRDFLLFQTPIEAQKAGYKQIPEIIHSFSSEFPIIKLAKNAMVGIECILNFDLERNAMIDLISNDGLMQTFDARLNKRVRVQLIKGLYLLKDNKTKETQAFQVLSAQENMMIHF